MPCWGSWVVAAALSLIACACTRSQQGDDSGVSSEQRQVASYEEIGPPRLLPAPGPHAPSEIRFEPPDGDASVLTGVAECGSCHSEIYSEWNRSVHHLASFNNPWYRVAVDRFRAAQGNTASQFCGGCHDPALVVGGGMLQDIVADDRRAHAGVSCTVCHGAEGATPIGNASFTVSLSQIPLPEEGADSGPALAAHLQRLQVDRGAANGVCVSCHRGVLGPETGHEHFAFGMDDASDWAHSAYAGQGTAQVDDVEQQDCVACHMPMRDGRRSHAFAAAHTPLAHAGAHEAHIDEVDRSLRSSVQMDVVSLTVGGETTLLPTEIHLAAGETAEIDVAIRNVGVGHRFPGGALDLHGTWLEVVAVDGERRGVLASGVAREFAAEQQTWRLRAEVVDDEGVPVRDHDIHDMRGVAWNHTIAPRDVSVVRYTLTVPADREVRGLSVRLLHQRHAPWFAELTCEASREPQALALDAYAARENGFEIDACAPQPVTEIAQIGTLQPSLQRPRWQRLYEYGLGLLHALQESLDQARAPLVEALGLLDEGSGRDRARVHLALGRLEGRQGRTEQAMQHFDEAARLAGGASIAYQRGQALARVWRWEQAADAFSEAATLQPGNDSVWQAYAGALGSLERNDEGYAAARQGLEAQPHNGALLLSQYLSLQRLDPDSAATTAAHETWLRRRPYDRAPSIRARCYEEVPGCSDERVPLTPRSLSAVPSLPLSELLTPEVGRAADP